MNHIKSRTLQGMAVAVTLAAATMTGSVQAHDLDYSVPAKLLLLSTILEPLHDHGHHYNHYDRHPRHVVSHHRHDRGKHKGHYRKDRRHNHSHGGYRDGQRGKYKHRYRD